MNRELIEKVAADLSASRITGMGIYDTASDAIRAVGHHLLSELEGFESACEMRAKIKKECGLS